MNGGDSDEDRTSKTDHISAMEQEGSQESSDPDEVDASPLHVLPLYSALPTELQWRVFESIPEGSRFDLLPFL